LGGKGKAGGAASKSHAKNTERLIKRARLGGKEPTKGKGGGGGRKLPFGLFTEGCHNLNRSKRGNRKGRRRSSRVVWGQVKGRVAQADGELAGGS